MSEQGEKTCPLCTEEMDLTDQQLKPCKCGYEICVWCWHHIMDMAEKDDTEGRCPACRTPYDKEKIVGMAEKCERLVAEVNSERKLKSQKSRPKTSEGRKHLSSVRVIQRNLVYIIGIPANLADEDLLQHKEYFGQYGKVLKVSISRTAGGAIQYSPTNTCSVYVTYSKEEEAVRCIHSVHGYFLDGKPLRACFGTTKYCHTWLRNMSCSNPDCLYLHEIGTQEDSFTKDEIISAYTRSRVQQITGATNNSQRRSGNTLPPPADEFCSSSPASSGKPITQTAPNIPASQVKGSPPNGTSGRSIALPAAAAWGLRVSNGRPPTPSSACSNGLAKQKPDAYNEKAKFLGEFNNGATTADQGPEADMGESSIISSILSLGFDEWDDSLTSPNNLAKLLNETDGSVKISSSWKVQNNNQSRFSFARQEDSVNQGSDLEPPFSDILHRPTRYSVPQKSLLNRDAYFDDLRDGFSSSLLEESDNFSSSRSIISSNLLSASRPQVSAPPGFSVPSRAPPPGFSFQERMDQTFGSVYGNHFLESSSSPRNQYPTQPTGNFGSIADVEFIDPAILAVGKGRLPNGISNNGFDTRSAFTQQLSASSENDPRLQLLLQQSLSSHQNMRFPDHHIGDRFSPISDPYNNIPSRLLEQSQASNLSSPFAQLSLPQPRNAHMLNNGHWEGWNGIRQTRNDLGMAELIRNEGLGFNKHVPGYEDLKFRMPSSGDMYNNRAFGI